MSAVAEEAKRKIVESEAKAAEAHLAVRTALAAPRAGKRKPCTFYVRGLCRFGDKCRHSHDAEQWPKTNEGDGEEEGGVTGGLEGPGGERGGGGNGGELDDEEMVAGKAVLNERR